MDARSALGAGSTPLSPDKLKLPADRSVPAAIGELADGSEIAQVGILVADLEREARAISSLVDLGSWSVYTYDSDTLEERTYHGEPGQFSMRIALAGSSPVVELIQPLQGPSIYHDWLADNPAGLHHIAVQVESLDEGIEAALEAGVSVLQSGRGYGLDGDGGFAYLDTVERAGVLLELLELPRRRRDPEVVWASTGTDGQSAQEES
jgi:methylmalonyl-CoA/ethylmalonyl-CoA epimerase